MNHFELKAKQKAENILANYDYCLVTPLICIDEEEGDLEPQKPVHCTDIDEIRDLYYNYYDVMIETPDGCNY